MLLLFDLDGTLVDSITLIVESMRNAFRDRPHAPTDAQWITKIGTPLTACFSDWAKDDDDVKTLVAGYREYQLAHHDRLVSAYPGVPETLKTLRDQGHRLGVVTSKGEELAHRALRLTGIDPLFDGVIGLESSIRHKPDPEPVLVALRRFNASPDQAAFVGDSPYDILAGNGAGVTSIAALWGPFTREQLAPSEPDLWLNSILELSAVVSRMTVRAP